MPFVEGFGGIHEDEEINSDVIVNPGTKSHASEVGAFLSVERDRPGC